MNGFELESEIVIYLKIVYKIAIHSETLHADNEMTVYLLTHNTKFKDFKIIRTRDMDPIESYNAAADVGGEYYH